MKGRNPDGRYSDDVVVLSQSERELHAYRTPAQAMMVHCIRCKDNSVTDVRRCRSVGCSLWPYRLGTNPFDDDKGAV